MVDAFNARARLVVALSACTLAEEPGEANCNLQLWGSKLHLEQEKKHVLEQEQVQMIGNNGTARSLFGDHPKLATKIEGIGCADTGHRAAHTGSGAILR